MRHGWLGTWTEARDVPAPLAPALLAYTSIWYPFREMEESAGPTGVATGAKRQIVGPGNLGCCVHSNCLRWREWCDLGHELSSPFFRGSLASGALGDIGPSAMLGAPVHRGLFSHPALLRLLISVSWSWLRRVPSLLGLKGFLRL